MDAERSEAGTRGRSPKKTKPREGRQKSDNEIPRGRALRGQNRAAPPGLPPFLGVYPGFPLILTLRYRSGSGSASTRGYFRVAPTVLASSLLPVSSLLTTDRDFLCGCTATSRAKKISDIGRPAGSREGIHTLT